LQNKQYLQTEKGGWTVSFSNVLLVNKWHCLFVGQVERHLRKLDQEVAKFKMELEADNAGITEVLERSMLLLSVCLSLFQTPGVSNKCI